MEIDPDFERFLVEVDYFEQHELFQHLDERDMYDAYALDYMGLLDSPDEQCYSNIVDVNGDPVYLAREGRNKSLSRYDRKGVWHTEFGPAIRIEDLYDVSPVEDHPPFSLAIPWRARVSEGSGASHEVTVTGWDGDRWITSGGAYPYLNAPVPLARTIDDVWRV